MILSEDLTKVILSADEYNFMEKCFKLSPSADRTISIDKLAIMHRKLSEILKGPAADAYLSMSTCLEHLHKRGINVKYE